MHSSQSIHSFRRAVESTRLDPSIRISMPVGVALVAGTLPMLAAVVGGHIVSKGLIELGKASEELFRGDRLPIRPLMKKASEENA